MEWAQEDIIQFLKAYETEPCIWNPQHADNKNRKKVNDAWRRVQESLSFNCSVEELKKKKDSLMASFRTLVTKQKKLLKSGISADKLPQPRWFAFETMERFLAPVYHCAVAVPVNNKVVT